MSMCSIAVPSNCCAARVALMASATGVVVWPARRDRSPLTVASSRQVGTISCSMSRLNGDHSLCSAVIGCTAAAQRIVAADASGLHPGFWTRWVFDYAAVGSVAAGGPRRWTG